MGSRRKKLFFLNTPSIKIAFLLTIFLLTNNYASNINSKCWQLLIQNKPLKAQEAFQANLSQTDKRIVGEAYRGLAFTAKFLGQNDTAIKMLFKSFIADKDTLAFNAIGINLLSFAREWIGHTIKDGYKVLGQISKKPGLYNGEHISLLINRYINDGKLSQAKKIANKMGIVRNFYMIGPFDNISGSGYKKVFGPEKEIDFSKKYSGKDGSEAPWFPFYNKRIDGWVFTENNYSSLNSILYYYSNIYSEKDQEVYIGFGASGSFKVFLNDNVVLADSVFRNTGTDMFMQRVKLFKGDNKLLIKLGCESKYPNFLIRFLNDKGQALNSVTYKSTKGDFKKGIKQYTNLTNSPFTEYIETGLKKRLLKDPQDIEAAILLMDFYNATELTDKGQHLANKYLKQYPQSSFWHSLYSESLLRSLKYTKAQTELKTAYRLCNYNFAAWENELDLLSYSASSKDILNFINNSLNLFQSSELALLTKFTHYSSLKNETEAIKIIEQLYQTYSGSNQVVNILATIFINQGHIKKAEAVLKNFIEKEKSLSRAFILLANLYLKMGQRSKVIETYYKAIEYLPNSPLFYYYLAELTFQHKEYNSAKKFIENALKIMPTSSTMISLKGAILNALGKKQDAINSFKESIRYTYNNFDAWDQLLPLEGKPELTSLTKLFNPDSLRIKAKSWKNIDNENGAVLAYIKDVFFYPSRCSRERYFLMIHLPTQNAIDLWKEYSITYNGYYQALNITRALSINANGKETPADINKNMVVFKTLQPGDDILVEWAIENYYQQDMAKQVWGELDFNLPFPVYKTVLRLVTPVNDTIPYTIQGENISVSNHGVGDFLIKTFIRKPYKNPPLESYSLIEPPKTDKVFYSTFKSWKDITHWYLNVTENKLEQTLELKMLVDSLTKDLTKPEEKVKKIHEYITKAIRYSFVSFRQSAWMPQPANEVLATKIGDCKDMSSLGKSLFDYAGIESNLVLVNTRDRNSIYPTFIGPNFNHCILSYLINDHRYYIDLTDNSLSVNKLPRMDQGALALIIKHDIDSLIHLPIDNNTKRNVIREISTNLDKDGRLINKVETIKSGVFASDMRTTYRFKSYKEQKKILKDILVSSYPEVKVDTFSLSDLYDLSDTIHYYYKYNAKNAAQFTGKTALYALDIPDRIHATSYPSEENRLYPIDMTHTWFGIGNFNTKGKLTIPKEWKLIDLPDSLSMSGEWGSYLLAFKINNNIITYRREANFNFNKPIKTKNSTELKNVLSKISQADNVQLMFYRK